MQELTPAFLQSAHDQSSISVHLLWMIPAVPIMASGVIALLKQPCRKTAASLAIGSLSVSLLLSLFAFVEVVSQWTSGVAARETVNFTWIQFGTTNVDLGWVLDPLSAVMLVMVTFVGLLIFIYSTGYMAQDENFTRFFCFLSLFAGAMLGVVIANSLLLLFMCWELVGLTSYLLIGIELMLNAANLNLIAFWRYGPHPEALTGMMFAIFSIAVAAAEAAVGLGLVIQIHRHAHTTDLDAMNRMKG